MNFKNLRWSVAVASLLGMLALLFGGYFAYLHLGLNRPMVQALKAEPGVQSVSISDEGSISHIEVALSPVKDLETTYDHLTAAAERYVKPGRYELTIADHRDQYLEDTYYRMQFLVQEALMRGNFEEMYGGLQSQAGQRSLDDFRVYVGERHIFLQLSKGSSYLYAVVPRAEGTSPMTTAAGGVGS
ncbi:MAG TPA: hypothetical protein VGL40_11210 [Bacillota bacterium]